MRKTLVAKLALAGTVGLAAALASGTADAASCVACHTMHNSQDNAPMRFDSGATPLPVLLRDDCIGCHTGTNTGTSIPLEPPRVIGTSNATIYGNNTLAGGDFYWVSDTGANMDARGHNVNLVSGADGNITGFDAPGGVAGRTAQLECAGTNGCHGDTSIATPLSSLDGAHHYQHNTITDTFTLTSVGSSFRYLLGIDGREDSDWEYTPGVGTAHNQYAAEARTTDTAGASAALIGTVCASCHASFHNKADAGSDTYGINDAATFAAGSWIRHPNDYAMKTTAEFSAYNTYLPNVPVGRTLAELGAVEDVANNTDQRIVLCLSCHRAHGSPYDDMLRWDYSLMLVGQAGGAAGTGCFACHSLKE